MHGPRRPATLALVDFFRAVAAMVGGTYGLMCVGLGTTGARKPNGVRMSSLGAATTSTMRSFSTLIA
jgi:hypothetical protein